MKHLLFWLSLLPVLVGCTSLPPMTDRKPSYAFRQAQETALGQLVDEAAQPHPGQSGFILLDTGRDAFRRRAALADAAQRSIDAQYYIWNADTAGQLMAAHILRAADRGVRVRLLLDDFGIGNKDATLGALNTHRNIEVRVYNPLRSGFRNGFTRWLGMAFEFDRLNRRMHNKTYVVDGSFAIVGGRNIGDEYFDMDPEMNFRDRDLMAAGPIVPEVSASFDAYWNSEWAYPIDALVSYTPPSEEIEAQYGQLLSFASRQENAAYAGPATTPEVLGELRDRLQEASWARAILVSDTPGKVVDSDDPAALGGVAEQLLNLFRGAKQEILIESAYFTLGENGLELVGELHDKNVRVAALTNSLASTDLPSIHAGYTRNRANLIRRGMELYEFRPDAASCQKLIEYEQLCEEGIGFSLHAKSIVFDRVTVYVGSFNVNPRSIFLNSETALIVYSSRLAERIAADIEENLKPENSWRVRVDERGKLEWLGTAGGNPSTSFHEPDTSLWLRTKSFFFSLLPLERYW